MTDEEMKPLQDLIQDIVQRLFYAKEELRIQWVKEHQPLAGFVECLKCRGFGAYEIVHTPLGWQPLTANPDDLTLFPPTADFVLCDCVARLDDGGFVVALPNPGP